MEISCGPCYNKQPENSLHRQAEGEKAMVEVLIRAGCFAAVILMGVLLRQAGFFKAEDFDVLARIVTRITLPASIVVSFSGREIDASMLIITALGFAFGVVYILLAFLMNGRASREKRAFEILNFSGYNIGNFTLPFAQSFLGPAGVVTASLFDTGNAVICLGGAYSVASMVKEGKRFSPRAQTTRLLSRSLSTRNSSQFAPSRRKR